MATGWTEPHITALYATAPAASGCLKLATTTLLPESPTINSWQTILLPERCGPEWGKTRASISPLRPPHNARQQNRPHLSDDLRYTNPWILILTETLFRCPTPMVLSQNQSQRLFRIPRARPNIIRCTRSSACLPSLSSLTFLA